ncbi:MAG: transcriptional coactivator p15/PC4 family protein [Pseudomonadota bacterium]
MDGILIGELEKNSTSKIKVMVREYKGREFVDVRTYFQSDDGEWQPTKKGIAISPAKVGELVRLLNIASKNANG